MGPRFYIAPVVSFYLVIVSAVLPASDLIVRSEKVLDTLKGRHREEGRNRMMLGGGGGGRERIRESSGQWRESIDGLKMNLGRT